MNLHHLATILFEWISSYPHEVVVLVVLSFLFFGSVLESIPVIGMSDMPTVRSAGIWVP